MRKTELVLGTLLVGVAANFLPLAASPASAVIPSVTVVTNQSASNSDAEKTVAAFCPAGTHVIGGGFTLDAEHVFIVRMQPISDGAGDRIEVTAVEDPNGTTLAWVLQVEAACTEVQNVPGFHIASATSAASSGLFISIRSFCNIGSTALGAGMRAINAGNHAHFTTQMDLVGTDHSTAAAFTFPPGSALNFQVESYTICASIPSSDVLIVETDSPANSDSPKQINAICPLPFLAIGGSGFANQFASISRLHIAPGATVMTLRGAEIEPSTADWSFELRAVCVRSS